MMMIIYLTYFIFLQVRPPLFGLTTESELETWIEEQFNLESKGEITITSIERKEVTPEVLYYVSFYYELMLV